MAFTVRVKVLRHMTGDKEYKPGDFRTLSVADAERLAETGAVEIVGKPANKTAKQPKKAKGDKTAPAPRRQSAPKLRNQAAPAVKTKGS